jgi:hypothetical protein
MPAWWHEGVFDVLCIINSIATAAALVGLGALRRKIAKLVEGNGTRGIA